MGAAPRHRALLDLHAVRAEVLDRVLDRARPDKADVAVSRPHALARDGIWLGAGTVDVQLLRAEAVREAALVELDELGAEDVAVEGVRALPVGDGDDDVVERD